MVKVEIRGSRDVSLDTRVVHGDITCMVDVIK